MTRNQIAFHELMESKRHNQATEREATRSNLAKERLTSSEQAETHRANLERESYNTASLAETSRSNIAKELESHRSNIAKELETKRSNVARETETHRSNLANELLAGIKTMTGSTTSKVPNAVSAAGKSILPSVTDNIGIGSSSVAGSIGAGLVTGYTIGKQIGKAIKRKAIEYGIGGYASPKASGKLPKYGK